MAELLTKEKQFIKMNEELDRMTKTAAPGHEPVAHKPDNRYYTYQRPKGPSSLFRKQGGGDGIVELVDPRSNALAAANKAAGGETYRSSNRQTFCSTSRNPPSHLANTPQQFLNKQAKNTCQSYSRVNGGRVMSSNNSTFTVKYRNPKFLESPSLEVLVKDERSSLRCEMDASNIGSLNSLAPEDNMSTGRRSHSSNNTVASKKNVSSDGLIKFLKSKIGILEEDHGRISDEMSKQKGLLEKALEHTRNLEQQRDHAKSKNISLSEKLAKSEKLLEEANKRLKERSIEQNNQQKELEETKRELKVLTQSNANLERRLFKANEDLESARKTLNLMKAAEREQNDNFRKESESKEVQIKSLKKQRANLLNAYKKQLFLIDNLKKQNILLEQAKMLDFGEKGFPKVLDWNIKS